MSTTATKTAKKPLPENITEVMVNTKSNYRELNGQWLAVTDQKRNLITCKVQSEHGVIFADFKPSEITDFRTIKVPEGLRATEHYKNMTTYKAVALAEGFWDNEEDLSDEEQILSAWQYIHDKGLILMIG